MTLSCAAWLALVAKVFHASTTRMRHVFHLNDDMASAQPPFQEYVRIPSLPFSSATSETSTVFAPGSLDLGKEDTIARCWTASPRSQDQRIKTTQTCLYSSRFHLSVSLSGKTGISTQKKVLQATMNSKELPCSLIPNEGTLVKVATVREPLDRFISGYKEIMLRRRVYFGHPDFDAPDLEDLPTEYSGFLTFLDRKTEAEKLAIFQAQDQETQQLKTQMFETFVQDYDGEHIFDRHLDSQTIKLWDPHGLGMARYDYVMEAANLTQDLKILADWVGAPLYPTDVKARSRTSDRLELESLHDETIQKICRLFALDAA
jgi:Sulfotransferase family